MRVCLKLRLYEVHVVCTHVDSYNIPVVGQSRENCGAAADEWVEDMTTDRATYLNAPTY